jgi:type I restriction enzyme, R subunit
VVRPPNNGDGFVNWLTTHLQRPRPGAGDEDQGAVVVHDGKGDLPGRRRGEPASGVVEDQQGGGVFFIRMNNSTRALPESEVDAYMAWRST